MRLISKIENSYDLFNALASKIRLSIVQMLLENHEMNMSDIATKLDVPQSTLTPHIKKLEKAGVISTRLFSTSRGSQKLCKIIEDKIIIDIIPRVTELKYFETDIDVGTYIDYNVLPTCGLSSTKKVIGYFDDPRYFSDPERFQAGIVWFSQGHVTYKFPNRITLAEDPVEIQVSMEICSEAPGVISYYPSDIYFSINDVEIGYWTSPGELFDRPGRLTPSWWFKNFPQYGRMKIITVNETGSYLDGLLFSSVKIQDLNLHNPEVSVKVEIPQSAENIGGITIFGKNFGDYDVGIKTKILYHEHNPAAKDKQ